MSLDRIKKVEELMELRGQLHPKINFDEMSNDELENYIKENTEKNHKENAITNYNEAQNYFSGLMTKNLISKDEYELFIESEKSYWSKDGR